MAGGTLIAIQTSRRKLWRIGRESLMFSSISFCTFPIWFPVSAFLIRDSCLIHHRIGHYPHHHWGSLSNEDVPANVRMGFHFNYFYVRKVNRDLNRIILAKLNFIEGGRIMEEIGIINDYKTRRLSLCFIGNWLFNISGNCRIPRVYIHFLR